MPINAETDSGTRAHPWELKTPPATSQFQVRRDEIVDPPALVVQVGKTQLRYRRRCIEDLHAMHAAHAGWMPLGSADEGKTPQMIPSKRGEIAR